MQMSIDNDWKAKIARDYFAMTWNGPRGDGIAIGEDNLENLYKSIDYTFHVDYLFARENGTIINQGAEKLKDILKNLICPLTNLKMTSFDIISINHDSVTFQSTAIADKKNTGERYTQYLKLTYAFREKKVCRVIVHYHSNYIF